MGKTRVHLPNGKIRVEDRSAKPDSISLLEANNRQRADAAARREEKESAAAVAHAAIDSAFRPERGHRRRVRKALRAV